MRYDAMRWGCFLSLLVNSFGRGRRGGGGNTCCCFTCNLINFRRRLLSFNLSSEVHRMASEEESEEKKQAKGRWAPRWRGSSTTSSAPRRTASTGGKCFTVVRSSSWTTRRSSCLAGEAAGDERTVATRTSTRSASRGFAPVVVGVCGRSGPGPGPLRSSSKGRHSMDMLMSSMSKVVFFSAATSSLVSLSSWCSAIFVRRALFSWWCCSSSSRLMAIWLSISRGFRRGSSFLSAAEAKECGGGGEGAATTGRIL
mmetsp:Transcript_9156/g.29681  ORF Transcript_9156/g.29681 Transcript_9156/m.29681 type:complete len:255 (-) Transcript_9156:914-1678(-)